MKSYILKCFTNSIKYNAFNLNDFILNNRYFGFFFRINMQNKQVTVNTAEFLKIKYHGKSWVQTVCIKYFPNLLINLFSQLLVMSLKN